MNCVSCHQEIQHVKSGMIVCPYCHTVNISSITDNRLSRRSWRQKVMSRNIAIMTVSMVCVLFAGSVIVFGLHPAQQSALEKTPVIDSSVKSKTPEEANVTSPTSPSSNSPQAAPAPSSPAKAPQSSSKGAATSVPPVPNCTKDTTYQPPGAVSISTSSPGLKQVIDTPHYYTVYGYTANQIRSQLNSCTPVATSSGAFDAETQWYINWAYNWYVKSNGLCALSTVTVGLHIKFVFPQWNNSPYAAADVAQKWQTYMTNLQTHEYGHRNLAIQYSNDMLYGLQNFPDTDCGSISAAANSYAQAKFAALQQASDNYDTQTHHGATQGATFP